MRDIERGYELCCHGCRELQAPPQYGDPRNAGAPSEARCRDGYCDVDADLLRELEAQIARIAVDMDAQLQGVPLERRFDLQDERISGEARALANVYCGDWPHDIVYSRRIVAAELLAAKAAAAQRRRWVAA